ncbi:MAG TPA: agmatine deiminase [Steroidobacteraceae bacterium]|nr:agmatine deiminase [Steroidobacteraceae bacterium]
MSARQPGTPRADGFHMPAEFEPHVGTWMLWPERSDNWRLGAKPAQDAFARVAAAISEFEAVTVGVSDAQFAHARATLPPRVRVVELSSNDAWMRDCGPTFVVNRGGEVRAINWRFNAWGGLAGGLYFPWHLDDAVAIKVAEIEHANRYDAPLVLEGGSIHVDGDGTLFTTAECLLNCNRNPDLSRGEIETALRDYLGVDKILWLQRGFYNDETSGHVDNLLAPVRPGVVALAWTDDPADPQHEISREAYEFLSRSTDARGRRIEIVKIHNPAPVIISAEESAGVDAVDGTLPRDAGDRLPASYVNYYPCNGGVIVPTFDDARDAAALSTLRSLYPGRQVVGIPAREILLGGGNIHCITQQQPVVNVEVA